MLWETDLHGVPLFLCSRVAPIAASMLLAWWAGSTTRTASSNPIPLVSLMTCALVFRLVFEENLFGYYFMAVSVALILLEVVRDRFRGTVAAWLALEIVAFNPIHAGFYSNLTGHTLDLFWAVPIITLAFVVVSVIVDTFYHRVRIYKLLWIVLASLTGESKLWGQNHPVYAVPHWLWQVILVPIALGLALKPLRDEVNSTRRYGHGDSGQRMTVLASSCVQYTISMRRPSLSHSGSTGIRRAAWPKTRRAVHSSDSASKMCDSATPSITASSTSSMPGMCDSSTSRRSSFPSSIFFEAVHRHVLIQLIKAEFGIAFIDNALTKRRHLSGDFAIARKQCRGDRVDASLAPFDSPLSTAREGAL